MPSFADQVYINHLREALWQQSTSFASVMIGAGFSLNAIPRDVDGSAMPTWTELVEKLIDDLYPASDQEAEWHRQSKLKSSSSTSAMLRLAEEYEIGFGRSRLDAQLMKYVPDLHFDPSPLHSLLLSLRWRDVFTTNWDTLLERASGKHPERDYQIVAEAVEISRSAQPRIVKLHGSFPNIRPFIVTEEDYRTYPEKMAPFVNLVRQAAMECVLCLIGFSGSDPNFLAWIGWVRDRLGIHQPRIFLVTLNSNSAAERQLLEGRGVRLIDLARLPGLVDFPAHERHRIALDWFLRNLAEGQPRSDALDWPDKRQRTGVRYWEPLPAIPPGPSLSFPGYAGQVEGEKDKIWALKAVTRWTLARISYPGWLVAPFKVRDRLSSDIQDHLYSIMNNLNGFPLFAKLMILYELVWQLKVCHIPPPIKMKEEIIALLKTTDLLVLNNNNSVSENFASIIDGTDEVSEISTQCREHLAPSARKLENAWLELHFEVLRDARENGNGEVFDREYQILFASTAQNDLAPRLSYESCLLALGQVDRKKLSAALQTWRESLGQDPYFWVLKAGVLAETGQLIEAERLCARAIEQLRQLRVPGGDNLPSISRECWALVLYLNLRGAITFRMTNLRDEASFEATHAEIRNVIKAKTLLVSNPWTELGHLEDSIERQAYNAIMKKTSGSFYRNSDWIDALPSLSALRLVDDVGYPAEAGNSLLTRSLRMLAVSRLQPFLPTLATTAFLRIGSVKDRFDEVDLFDKVWIARLPQEDVENLSRNVESLGIAALGHYKAERNVDQWLSQYWLEKAKFAAQLQGRLVTRLDEARIDKILDGTLDLFSKGDVDHVWLQDSYTFLFDQALSALLPEKLPIYLVKLLRVPYKPNEAPFGWPSPLVGYQKARRESHREPIGGDLQAIFNNLIRDAASDQVPIRSEALLRLAIFSNYHLFRDEEIVSLANVLWSRLDEDGLPKETSLLDDAFMMLPEPLSGQADDALRRAYLWDKNPFDVPNALKDSRAYSLLQSRLLSLIQLVSRKDMKNGSFRINQIEAHALTKRLIDLYEGLLRSSDRVVLFLEVKNLLFLVQLALAEAAIPNLDVNDQETARLVHESVDRWSLAQKPAIEAIITMARLHPGASDSIVKLLWQKIRSHKPDVVNEVVAAIGRWIRCSARWNVPKPPGEFAVAIAMIIEDRWPEVLLKALEAAREYVLVSGRQIDSEFVLPVLSGLAELHSETAYFAVKIGGSDYNANYIGEVRARCVRLCKSLEEVGHATDVVNRWIVDSKSDPLFEVRNALS